MYLINKKIDINLFEDYYKLKCDPVNIAWTGFEKSPSKKKLKDWFILQIDSQTRDIFLFYNEKLLCIGYCYFDYLNDNSFEESIGVYSPFSGQGIADEITKFEIKYALNNGYKQIKSWVSEQNIPSIKRLIKNGFIKSDSFIIKELPLLGGTHKFYEYKKNILDDKI